ncbi:UDP-glucose/GDP-mannose dehydrogenase family protein [Cohnella endophytica]|uniref:UDP-glucose 6-dehydrogenase n=1 Tax=Cohnella endophytica TaxID=2419778 RepID=A0A494XAU2_9BACL|nr:UDP-glucose/GDP-mannose dehydrogenase family protein [Cohnella endophytica]RKP47202.1 UDP-glucose/GDP-mannose dehydrogenase family protein [Cohnella endophytica]
MKIAIVGAGIVGLTTGAGFADLGHSVHCVDIDTAKIAQLSRGIIPYHEPGLEALVLRNTSAGRLTFGHDPSAIMHEAELVFLAVGTPSEDTGEMSLAALWSVIDRLEPWSATANDSRKIIAIKSTVPIGTAERAESRIRNRLPVHCLVDVVSIPEFMREGCAVRDFFEPTRIVIGTANATTAERLNQMHQRLPGPIMMTDRRSAELAKLAANACLAVKISFANEIAALAEQTGADYPSVAHSLGLDPRIGPHFLAAGLGYGGSCLPKDARALVRMADEAGAPQTIVEAAVRANAMLPLRMVRKLEAALSDPSRRKVALLGLAFKPGTDDIREAPSLRLIAELNRRHPGIAITAYDPEANHAARKVVSSGVTICDSAEEALRGADAAIIVTEWREFRQINAEDFKNWMNRPIIMDGRNALDAAALNAQGVVCIGVGRLPVIPKEPSRKAGEPVT